MDPPIAEVAILLVHERRHSYVTRFLISRRFRLLTRLLHVYSQQSTEVRGFLFSRFLDVCCSTITCGTLHTPFFRSRTRTQSSSHLHSDDASDDARDVTTSLLHTTRTHSHAVYKSALHYFLRITTSAEFPRFRGFVILRILMYM